MSPMRPDEWDQVNGFRWLAYEQYRAAHQRGVHRANTDAKAAAEMAAEDD